MLNVTTISEPMSLNILKIVTLQCIFSVALLSCDDAHRFEIIKGYETTFEAIEKHAHETCVAELVKEARPESNFHLSEQIFLETLQPNIGSNEAVASTLLCEHSALKVLPGKSE